MAMETEIVRSDTEKFLEYIKQFFEKLFRNLYAKLSPKAKKAIRTATDKVYRNHIQGKKRVLEDGVTKDVISQKGLTFEETLNQLEKNAQNNIKCWIEGYNHNSSEVGKRYTIEEINNFRKISTNLKNAKQKLEDKPNSVKLQEKYEKCKQAYDTKVKQMKDGFDEKKYNQLVVEICNKHYIEDPTTKMYKLTDEEKQECYKNACSGEPFTFKITYNASHSAYVEKCQQEIREQRIINGEQTVDATLDPEKSDILSKLQSEEMFYDEEKYTKIYEQARELKGSELSAKEVLALKQDCKYQGVTFKTFIDKAEQEGKGYLVYQYDKEQATQVCKELNSNDTFSNFTCAYANKEKTKVNIYIYDEDDKFYDYKTNTSVKHYSSADTKLSKTASSMEINKCTLSIPVEQVDYAKNVFKDVEYSLSYENDEIGDRKATFTLSSITQEEAKRLLDKELSNNVVKEKLEEINQKDFEKARTDIMDKIKNKWSIHNIITDLKNKAQDNKNTAEFINKYNEMVAFNNGKDMSDEDYEKFVNAYYSNNVQEIDNFKEYYQNKTSNKNQPNTIDNNVVNNDTNKDTLDDNMLSIDIDEVDFVEKE